MSDGCERRVQAWQIELKGVVGPLDCDGHIQVRRSVFDHHV
jgi:hypothetical protein